MKNVIAILAVLSLAAFAGQVAVNLDPIQRTDADWLVYDDGTAQWLTWGGMYRGVWFNTEDFVPGETSAAVEELEFWFYHHSSYPWDTSDTYIELWNGDAMAPVTQLDQTMITAIHYAPQIISYATPIVAEGNFWGFQNTEMSAGGWPAILGDVANSGHSFFSDDFIIWEPWTGDYFISALATIPAAALDNTTWGSLKATF